MGLLTIDWNQYSSTAYVIIGAVTLTINGVLLISCLTQRIPRFQKEFYILVVCLATADCFEAFGYLGVGIEQLRKLSENQTTANVTAVAVPCAELPRWTTMFSRTGGVASAVLHTVVAGERLLATVAPVYYYKRWRWRHVIRVLTIGYGIVGLFFAFQLFLFAHTPYQYDAVVCKYLGRSPEVASKLFWYLKCVVAITAFALCAITAAVRHMIKRHSGILAGECESAWKLQAAITYTMLLITGVQFALICIPSFLRILVISGVFACALCEKSTIILGLLNSASGFAIYMITNKDMRDVVRHTLYCRKIVSSVVVPIRISSNRN